MKYQLAIFDMDGTILNTLEDLTDCMNYILRMYRMPERSIEEVRRFVGNGIRRLIERAVVAGTNQELIDHMFSDFAEYYKDHSAIKTRPYEGIQETIEKLRSMGYRTAVVSNKADFAVQDLCQDFFPGLFDMAVGEREGMRRKPYPDSVWLVLDTLGVKAEDAVYIGDSEVDLETADNSNIDIVPVTWGFRDKEFLVKKGAKGCVDTPEELVNALK